MTTTPLKLKRTVVSYTHIIMLRKKHARKLQLCEI